MRDQANTLRRTVAERGRVIAVTSGKGGVGKTNVSTNLALALASVGWRTLILDADLSLANVDVVCGIVPPWNLGHVQRGERTLASVVARVAEGVDVVAGASGLPEFLEAGPGEVERLLEGVREVEGEYDCVLIDTGAGLDTRILSFLSAADQVLLVAVPEPTAMTDAYALLKTLARTDKVPPVSVVMNRVTVPEEGRRAAERLQVVAKRFLDLPVELLGLIPEDPRLPRAVKAQRPLLLEYPRSPAAIALLGIAARLAKRPVPATGFEAFLERLRIRLGGLPV
jgi:flagellar biosynthesis protein FlhG